MPTAKPRVNITFEEDTTNILTALAKREKKSVSSLAKELILEAMELREDLSLSSIAKARDVEGVKRIKHRDAWK